MGTICYILSTSYRRYPAARRRWSKLACVFLRNSLTSLLVVRSFVRRAWLGSQEIDHDHKIRGMNMKKILRLASISVVAAIGFTAILVAITSATNAQEIYKGKTIRVLIGYGAGGGYDRYGRQVARHIGR